LLALGATAPVWMVACGNPADYERELGLTPLSRPSGFETMDPAVQAQYVELRGALDRLLVSGASERSWLGRAYGELGRWYHVYRFYQHARSAYRNAQTLDQREVRWPYYLGHVEMELSQLAAARAAFRRALVLSPGELEIEVWLAEAELDLGQPEAALPLLEHALEQDPRCVRALAALGRYLLAAHDYEGAAHRFEAALALQPSAALLHYPLGQAYRALGRLELARHHLELVPPPSRDQVLPALRDPMLDELRRINRGSQHHQLLGLRALKEGRGEQAIAAFRRAVEANPRRIDPHVKLAAALDQAGRRAAARAQLETLLRVQPNATIGHLMLAQFDLRDGAIEPAERHLRAALAIDPDHKEAHLRLARLLRRTSRPELALAELRQVLRLDPVHAEARYWEVACLLQLGRREQAELALRAALRALPDDTELPLLAQQLAAAGRRSPAEQTGRP
jgi:tetratricopeptide (TPR) repeat protein